MKGLFQKFCKSLRKRLSPVLRPSEGGFDSLAVYNPTVLKVGNCLYMLYRARGRSDDLTGVIGLATSTDGVHWTKHPQPVLYPSMELDRYGCEDPRVVKIGAEYFLTYTGVSDWKRGGYFRSHVVMATSRDLVHYRKLPITWRDLPFHWQGLNLKAATLLPFKVRGQWMMFFTVVWDHWQSAIGYAVSDDGQHWSVPSPDFLLTPRKGYFDARVVEVGSVPFIMDGTIVLIYNGKDHSAYRVGIALLAKDNPTFVLWRSEKPILEPSLPWERAGLTPEVTFVGGFLDEGEGFRLYYGAADTVVGMATEEREGCEVFLDEKVEAWLWQCIRRFCRRHPTPKNIAPSDWQEELIQTGRVAAVEAMEIFDESYQVPLELFVRQRIWNALKTLWRAEQERGAKVVSLEELGAHEEEGGDKGDWQEWFVEPGREQEIDRSLVREAVQRLPERERRVIERLFWDGETLEGIAKELGVSIVRVHKLKRKALRLLREMLEPSEKKPSRIKKHCP